MENREINVEKSDIIKLDEVLSQVKVGKLSNEDVFKLLENKIELSKQMKEIREANELAWKELKPAELSDDMNEELKTRLEEKWKMRHNEFYIKFVKEVVAINFQKISKEVLLDLVKENNISFGGMELIARYMV